MKGEERKLQRNFHVAKRITNRLERQYGVDLQFPYAKDLVAKATSYSGSSRSLQNAARKDSPSRTPEGPSHGPRARTLASRNEFLRGLKCYNSSYDDWADDDYLFLQIGPISSGSQNTIHRDNRHPDCDEPECGTNDWYCDLCQEAILIKEPVVFEEPSVTTHAAHRIPAVDRLSIDDPLPSSRSLQYTEFMDTCPIVQGIRTFRRAKKIHDVEEFFEPDLWPQPALENTEDVYFDSEEHPEEEFYDALSATSSLASDSPIPQFPTSMDSTSISQESNYVTLSEPLFVLLLILQYGVDQASSQPPGFVEASMPLSITDTQNRVFDRGRFCRCCPWLTRTTVVH